MRILYICHRIPYPPNKGDKIRSFNEIKHLSASHEVHLATAVDDPRDRRYEACLNDCCSKMTSVSLNRMAAKVKGLISMFMLSDRSLSVSFFYSSRLQRIIDSWLSFYTYDAVVCFSSSMAEYLFRSSVMKPRFQTDNRVLKQRSKTENVNSKLIMDFCDVDSEKWRQYSVNGTYMMNLIYKTEHRRLLAYEKRINRLFNHSVFVSRQEANLFLRMVPNAQNVTTIPNGIDHRYFSPHTVKRERTSKDRDSPVLLFTGAMDYHANVEGVAWFCRQIYPRIERKFKNTQFYIVGSNPASKVRKLAGSNGIKVTGFVEDIRPYYEMADICIVPLRLARGIQNKILEAMAMGKAIVTTAAAADGIGAIRGEHLLVEDTPEGFAQAVEFLIENREVAKKMGINARKHVKENFSWPAHMTKFENLLRI